MRTTNKIWLLCGILIGLCACNKTSVKQSPLAVSYGQLYRTTLYAEQLHDSVLIDILVPENYSFGKQYPVLYMHDGQNLFDANSTWNHQAWEVDEALAQLSKHNACELPITVGIHCLPTRLADMMPNKIIADMRNDSIRATIFSLCENAPRADNYLQFIVGTVKPFVDKHFRTKADRANTFVAGSSMGGLVSMYALCEYPDIFGGAACLSPHWSGTEEANRDFPDALERYIAANLPRDGHHKLYMDNGTLDCDSVYLPYFDEINAIVATLGYDDMHLLTVLDEGAGHNEKAWAARLLLPLTFLLEKK